MNFFGYDSLIIRILSKVADFVYLNLLVILFSLPIITMGASLTAAHYTALKMCRNEGTVLKNFWKSFRENIKQATIIWLILFGHSIVAIYVLHVATRMGSVMIIIQGIVLVMLIISMLIFVWIFPLQAKFSNTIGATYKVAFYFVFKYLWRTICMVLLHFLSIVLFFALGLEWLSIWLFFGVSIPIYLCAVTYNKVFKKLEERA